MKRFFRWGATSFLVSLLVACASSESVVPAASSPEKREFRGAWIQCVNGQFEGMPTQQMKKTLSYQLDELWRDGVNAIIFQVRPECDALYPSSIEPWSRFLTGQQGRAPQPYWDPLQWMIDECHKRGMELHAWINPYRARTKTTNNLASNHIAARRPDLVFEYDGLLILNPGFKENREYICKVVDDIVARYDVDGLHIDDYFYPYPAAGQVINDQAQFERYNKGFRNIADWRRNNVNEFIEELSKTIHKRKPWVKFGVSPFGIYRNARNAPGVGSNTNGTQNYDDLYADVLLWVNNGLIDYCVPQIYWEIGNKAADYETLIRWWDKHASNRPLFIGEDVERTVKYPDPKNPNAHQMGAKFKLHKDLHNVNGTVLWYAKAAVDNVGNYGTSLRNNFWRYRALQPIMPFIDEKAPGNPKKLKVVNTKDGDMLFWTAPKGSGWKDKAVKFVVYKFGEKEKVDLSDPSRIVSITANNYYKLPQAEDKKTKTVYVVTALDRMSNESKGAMKKVKR